MSAGAEDASRRRPGVGRGELALALVGIVVAVGLVEIGARMWLDPTRYHREETHLEFDPVLGWRGVPNASAEIHVMQGSQPFALNADGFRGRLLPTAAAGEGTERLLFLGDSFLVGIQVREEALLTRRLEASYRGVGRDVEVYNAAVIDYGTAQQRLLLDRLAERVEPDVVVLGLYVGNDVVNNALSLAGTTSVSPGDPVRPYLVPEGEGWRQTWVDPLRGVLRRVSRVFTRLERWALAESVDAEEPAQLRPPERLRAGRAPREHLELWRQHLPGSPWEEAWGATFALLRSLRDRCEALGARLLVVLIPSEQQVEHGAFSIRLEGEALAFARQPLRKILDWNLPSQRFAVFLREEGIDAVDLLAPLREAASQGVVYSQDAHLNARGHAVAARAIEVALASRAPVQLPDVDGAPVHLPLTLGRDLTWLDFGTRPYLEFLGNGWLVWQPTEGALLGGWQIGPSALVAVPVAQGAGRDLVVRGSVPDDAALPIRGRMKFVGGEMHHFVVQEAGGFELRLPPEAVATDREGYSALLLGPGTSHLRDGTPIGFVVHGLGYESGDARDDP